MRDLYSTFYLHQFAAVSTPSTESLSNSFVRAGCHLAYSVRADAL